MGRRYLVRDTCLALVGAPSYEVSKGITMRTCAPTGHAKRPPQCLLDKSGFLKSAGGREKTWLLSGEDTQNGVCSCEAFEVNREEVSLRGQLHEYTVMPPLSWSWSKETLALGPSQDPSVNYDASKWWNPCPFDVGALMTDQEAWEYVQAEAKQRVQRGMHKGSMNK